MKKGFTLIELLAVIVILAIIALIATPIVLNIINDTKESATLRGAGFYIDALQNEIALENIKQGGSFNPSVCIIESSVLTCDGKPVDIKVDGEKPGNGSKITFEDGKVTSVYLKYPSGTVTQNNKGELVLGEGKVSEPEKKLKDLATVSTELGVTNVHACATTGVCEPGTAFAIKVNEEDTYKFYVLNEESGKVNLIMASNLGSKDNPTNPNVVWTTEDDYKAATGKNYWAPDSCDYNDSTDLYEPITALKELKLRTSNWTNLKEYSYELEFGLIYKNDMDTPRIYSGEYVQNVRARLPKLVDTGCTGWGSACQSWLGEEINDESEGYWLMDSIYDCGVFAYYVTYDGVIMLWASLGQTFGLRPVITIEK